jgi:uncharacterized protein with HEPN domain
MNENDTTRLRHMLDAAREALAFAEGRSAGDLSGDRMFFLAIVKEIEIIGEAAGRISEDTRNALPRIPWLKVIGIRNRLIHAYADVDLSILWSTVMNALPELRHELEKALTDS